MHLFKKYVASKNISIFFIKLNRETTFKIFTTNRYVK